MKHFITIALQRLALVGCCSGLLCMPLASASAQTTQEKPAASGKKAGSSKKAGSEKKQSVSQSKSIAVGEGFPEVALKDQNENDFSLHEALKKGPVALVVYRSASW